MSKHFKCTACGKCCYGQLPLTWKDAAANASRFPIGLVWTPIQKGSKDYKQVRELGVIVKLPDRRELASLIVPTSFIPSIFPCPSLENETLCGIHNDKPSRCKTMPFYPYREERFQGEHLNPRKDWDCDTSASAPIVFEQQKILDRTDFDKEKQDIVDQVPLLQRYAEYMLKYTPSLITNLAIASTRQKGGHIVTSLSSFLTATKNPDAKNIAALQVPVLNTYIAKTAGIDDLQEFHKHYINWAKEMTYLAQRPDPVHLLPVK